jgi:hypothetical protein
MEAPRPAGYAGRYLAWNAVLKGDRERSRILRIINEHGFAGPGFFEREDFAPISAWLTRRTEDAPECIREMVRGAAAVATAGSPKGRIGSDDERGALLTSVLRFVVDALVRTAPQ